MRDSDVIIRVEGLSKKYAIHHEGAERHATLKDSIAHRSSSLARWLNPFTFAGQLRRSRLQAAQLLASKNEDFWALKDVNFEIRRGDRVGIIGRNGAGKSTLLKVLSRITEPTSGRVEIRGRVASLLEVGTGFHPELSGRENIYLNGAILGMSRREIRSKFDEIVDFAEVEKFLDTPVKRYSSGMYVRLAFAVAAHLEPEILVVDEVLAVGDASFQKKCLGKMQEVADGEGRTILFVSHNMIAVRQLCNQCISLQAGCIAIQGEPEEVIEDYLGSEESTGLTKEWMSPVSRPGDGYFRIHKIDVINSDKPGKNPLISDPVEIRITYQMLQPSDAHTLTIETSIHLKTADGVVVLATGHCRQLDDDPVAFRGEQGTMLCDTCHIPADFLNDISYSIDAYVLTNSTRVHAHIRDCLTFKVVEGEREGFSGKIIGVVRPALEWTSEQLLDAAGSD
jgi:lipopolysaccharide transport system ATP-binding protein